MSSKAYFDEVAPRWDEGIAVGDAEETCCAGSACGDQSADVSVFLASATKPGSTRDAEATRAQVREHYAAAARGLQSGERAGCCARDGGNPLARGLYGEGEVAGLPVGAVAASLGCANPTALARLEPGEVVLDLGSGAGLDVLLSARRVAPGGRAYGLDMTDEMLELARRNQAAAGIENAEFLKGTLEDVPLPDRSVDVVVSNCVLNLSPDKDRAFREAFRVLRPGGRLAVADLVLDAPLPAELRDHPGLWCGCVGGALTPEEFRRRLEAAGFVEVGLEELRAFGPDDLGDGERAQLAALVAAAGVSPEALPRRVVSVFVTARRP